MHLLPEVICDFDSLIESDSGEEGGKNAEENEGVGSDIELDFDIASSSPIYPDHDQQGLTGDGNVYTLAYDVHQAQTPEDAALESIDIDIFDDNASCAYRLDEDDGCDADVSSEIDILDADYDMDDFSMDVDAASSVASGAEFRNI